MTKERPRPELPEVTLVAVTSVALGATVEALRKSMREAQFARVLLLSDTKPAESLGDIGWQCIEPLPSRADYSRFMLHRLGDHIATRHALCVQWDGFVLNGRAWDARFLEYDYIGAVWPHLPGPYRVGNGGFSLRSKRLLDACRDLPFDGSQSEDVTIGRTCRARLEGQGMSFAPEEVARQFAYERTRPMGTEFGFHGAYNLVRYLSPDDALRIFSDLEPGMLARNERYEMLRWAVARRRWKLARLMFAKLIEVRDPMKAG